VRRSKGSYETSFLAGCRSLGLQLANDPSPICVVERGLVDAGKMKTRIHELLSGRPSPTKTKRQLCNLLLLEFWLRQRGESNAEMQEAKSELVRGLLTDRPRCQRRH